MFLQFLIGKMRNFRASYGICRRTHEISLFGAMTMSSADGSEFRIRIEISGKCHIPLSPARTHTSITINCITSLAHLSNLCILTQFEWERRAR